MTIKFKKTKKDGSLLKGIIIGTCSALLLTFLGCALSAWGILAQRIPESGAVTAAAVTAALSGAGGGAIASWVTGQKRLQVCLITAAAYFLCLLSLTALFFDGKYRGVGRMALAAFGGGAVPILLGILPKKQKGTRHIKRAYR